MPMAAKWGIQAIHLKGHQASLVLERLRLIIHPISSLAGNMNTTNKIDRRNHNSGGIDSILRKYSGIARARKRIFATE